MNRSMTILETIVPTADSDQRYIEKTLYDIFRKYITDSSPYTPEPDNHHAPSESGSQKADGKD